MIDSLRRFEAAAGARRPWEQAGVPKGEYVLVTLHRPSNVDSRPQLQRIVTALAAVARRAPVVFPMHPRTRDRLTAMGLLSVLERAGVRCTVPVGYLDFLGLEIGAGAIVTDSGGVQEEATALGVPCYTLRPNTERPITISHGTNTLLGEDPAADRRRPAVRPGPDRATEIPGLGRARRRAHRRRARRHGGAEHCRPRRRAPLISALGRGRSRARPSARLRDRPARHGRGRRALRALHRHPDADPAHGGQRRQGRGDAGRRAPAADREQLRARHGRRPGGGVGVTPAAATRCPAG